MTYEEVNAHETVNGSWFTTPLVVRDTPMSPLFVFIRVHSWFSYCRIQIELNTEHRTLKPEITNLVNVCFEFL
jgi:hypothetical protein